MTTRNVTGSHPSAGAKKNRIHNPTGTGCVSASQTPRPPYPFTPKPGTRDSPPVTGSPTPLLPEVVARFVPTRQRHPGDAVGELVIVCPWCRKTHRHGAGGDRHHLAYGHRVAHCDAPGSSAGYVLVPEVAP